MLELWVLLLREHPLASEKHTVARWTRLLANCFYYRSQHAVVATKLERILARRAYILILSQSLNQVSVVMTGSPDQRSGASLGMISHTTTESFTQHLTCLSPHAKPCIHPYPILLSRSVATEYGSTVWPCFPMSAYYAILLFLLRNRR